MKPEERLIISLDFGRERAILRCVDMLKERTKLFKIGSGPFVACGPAIIDRIRNRGCKVFLDLKFHDIPHTVAKAVEAAVRPGVFMLNVHALGGPEMMKGLRGIVVKRASALRIERPRIVGVTILTSLDQKTLKRVGIHATIEAAVSRLARLAKNSGLDGVVSSPNEIASIRKVTGRDFLIVAPGVRPGWAAADDQRRVQTPRETLRAGADYLVIGRPVTAAANPCIAADRILHDMRTA